MRDRTADRKELDDAVAAGLSVNQLRRERNTPDEVIAHSRPIAGDFEPTDHECMLWVTVPRCKHKFIVCTGGGAYTHARGSFAATCVLRWEEWVALGAGLAEVDGVERQTRLLEALNYFAAEQGVPPLQWDDQYLPA